MSFAAVCMSHSPLLEFGEVPQEIHQDLDQVFERARSFIREFDPTLVVTFGPDHYNGFFYDLMPPFCICYQAKGVGDYDTLEGPLNTDQQLAEEMAQAVLSQDVDVAISRGAELDHGAVQLLELFFDDPAAVRTVPVFVNGLATPFSPMRRVRLLGEAIGQYLSQLDERVLLLGSGGLSHDPPVPAWVTANDAQRDFLLQGRHPTPEARAARQQRTIDTAAAFARGEADIMDLNPEWDQAFLDLCRSGQTSRFDDYSVDQMTAEAGHSVHEVRTWVAALSALKKAAGGYQVQDSYYRPIKEVIAGFGMIAVTGDQR